MVALALSVEALLRAAILAARGARKSFIGEE